MVLNTDDEKELFKLLGLASRYGDSIVTRYAEIIYAEMKKDKDDKD